MKNLKWTVFAICFSVAIHACKKDDDIMDPVDDPIDNPTDTSSTDTTNNDSANASVNEADVQGLAQNRIKADGVSEDRLYITTVGGYESDGEQYYTLHITGEENHYVDITIKGSELKVGNYSIKRFQLGSSPLENQAVVYVSIGGNLMDFETTDQNAISIQKDENDFYVVKMAPIVGNNRNSWDDVITEPISFHVVSNPAKVVTSNPDNDVFENDLFSYRDLNHQTSGQNQASVVVDPITLTFYDYDMTVGSLAKESYLLRKAAPSVSEVYNGTVPKSVELTYSVNWVGWQPVSTKDQYVEVELKEKTIWVKFENVEFENASNPSDTRIASGEWEIARLK